MKPNWGFLFTITDPEQYDQHVWDYYFWLNLNLTLNLMVETRR